VVAAAVDPAHENDILPRVFGAQLSTHPGPLQSA
jgi:hypothetical protein